MPRDRHQRDRDERQRRHNACGPLTRARTIPSATSLTAFGSGDTLLGSRTTSRRRFPDEPIPRPRPERFTY